MVQYVLIFVPVHGSELLKLGISSAITQDGPGHQKDQVITEGNSQPPLGRIRERLQVKLSKSSIRFGEQLKPI